MTKVERFPVPLSAAFLTESMFAPPVGSSVGAQAEVNESDAYVYNFDFAWDELSRPLENYSALASAEGLESPSLASVQAAQQLVGLALMESLFGRSPKQIEVAGADNGGAFAIFVSPDRNEEATVRFSRLGEISECVYVYSNYVADRIASKDPQSVAQEIASRLFR